MWNIRSIAFAASLILILFLLINSNIQQKRFSMVSNTQAKENHFQKSPINGKDASNVTVDCIDWNSVVDLSRHPLGPSNKETKLQIQNNVVKNLETSDNRRDFFKKDYASKRGQAGYEQDTICGVGSTYENTRLMIKILHSVTDKLKEILKKDKIRFLDSSCGDMFWMPEFLNSRSDVIFTGYDLDEGNIESNKKKFSDKSWKFKQHDAVSDKITESFDLILSRHTMIHLYNADAIRVIKNFKDSGSKYFLMTTLDNQVNEELPEARYRPVNLFRAPFYLPAPVCVAKDIVQNSDSSAGMYTMLSDAATITFS